jgi:two-component system OmpR family sensor kinase
LTASDTRRPRSIRRRLVVSLAALVGLLWLAATALSMAIASRALDEAFDAAQLEIAKRLLPLAVEDILNRDAGDAGEGPERVASLLADENHYTYVVRSADGTVLLRSADAVGADFPTPPVLGFAEDATHRYYAESAIRGAFVIQVADPLARRRAALVNTGLGLIAPLPVLIALGGVGIWFIVRRGLRPTAVLRRQIESRHGDALDEIGSEGLPEEIAPLAREIDRLMARVRRTIEAERSFTANSAHELRTPIAGALAQTQVLIQSVPDGPTRDRARRIETALQSLASLAGKLVDLSRAESGLPVPDAPIDLAPILALVIEDCERAARAPGRVRLSPGPDGALLARVDPDAFAILLRNLVDNAIRHGDPREPVSVRVAPAEIRIVNGCPAIDPAVLEGLRARFVRGSASPGSGLGLSIADAVARSIGGEFEVRSPATGRSDGFEAVVRLPRG